jgi:hypothetical protein
VPVAYPAWRRHLPVTYTRLLIPSFPQSCTNTWPLCCVVSLPGVLQGLVVTPAGSGDLLALLQPLCTSTGVTRLCSPTAAPKLTTKRQHWLRAQLLGPHPTPLMPYAGAHTQVRAGSDSWLKLQYNQQVSMQMQSCDPLCAGQRPACRKPPPVALRVAHHWQLRDCSAPALQVPCTHSCEEGKNAIMCPTAGRFIDRLRQDIRVVCCLLNPLIR